MKKENGRRCYSIIAAVCFGLSGLSIVFEIINYYGYITNSLFGSVAAIILSVLLFVGVDEKWIATVCIVKVVLNYLYLLLQLITYGIAMNSILDLFDFAINPILIEYIDYAFLALFLFLLFSSHRFSENTREIAKKLFFLPAVIYLIQTLISYSMLLDLNDLSIFLFTSILNLDFVLKFTAFLFLGLWVKSKKENAIIL